MVVPSGSEAVVTCNAVLLGMNAPKTSPLGKPVTSPLPLVETVPKVAATTKRVPSKIRPLKVNNGLFVPCAVNTVNSELAGLPERLKNWNRTVGLDTLNEPSPQAIR